MRSASGPESTESSLRALPRGLAGGFLAGSRVYCRTLCRHNVTGWNLLLPGTLELEVAENLDRSSQMREPQPREVGNSPRNPPSSADPQLKAGKCGFRVGKREPVTWI